MNCNTKTDRRWNFVAMKWARDYVRGLNPLERGLLLQLAMHCDLTFTCYPAQKTLAENFGRDQRTIRTALKSLEDKGLISRKRRRACSTLYTLKVPVDFNQDRKPTSALDRKSTSGRDRKLNVLEVTTDKKPQQVARKKEVSVEKIGETSNDVTHGENTKVKKNKQGKGKDNFAVLDQDHAAALSIAAKYYKVDPTRTVMVGFWFALMRRFHSTYPMVGKNLTKPQYKHLHSLFAAFGDDAYYVIAAAVCDWQTASVHAAQVEGLKASSSGYPKYGDIPKCGPTTTFISRAATGFADYWSRNWHQAKAA